jgi:hypothetical protein
VVVANLQLETEKAEKAENLGPHVFLVAPCAVKVIYYHLVAFLLIFVP